MHKESSYEIIISLNAENKICKATTTVIIPLYNYEHVICDTLDSVNEQTIEALSLIIVDDASTDGSLERAGKWLEQHRARFDQAILVSHNQNTGLSNTRNTGFSLAATPYVFALDADNKLYPRCLARCEQALHDDAAAFAYPMLERIGAGDGLLNTQIWNRARLKRGNYIDAMALIRKRAWQAVGGYMPLEHGWEDYDLWCSFAEQGWHGVRVPEILAQYRVHPGSMLQSRTNRPRALLATSRILKKRHKWLKLQH